MPLQGEEHQLSFFTPSTDDSKDDIGIFFVPILSEEVPDDMFSLGRLALNVSVRSVDYGTYLDDTTEIVENNFS